MGHGKETPRQKMIGMMYLVLTALLALNVSKSVLDAFVIVDKGLNKTVENFSSKSGILYAALDKAAAANPAKAGELRDQSNKIKEGANELSLEVDKIKAELVLIADKVEVGLDTINTYELQAKDNLDIGGQVMVLQKRGEELKEKIIAYREMSKTLAPGEQGINLRESLDKSLSTEDPEGVNEGGVKETWESSNFEHLPLVAVFTMLTKIKTDIRNAESDVVSHLYGQIGADDFRFNKIEAIVLPKSNYIMQGDRYEADVFIAASDSTVVPEIKVAGGKLKVVDGRGKYAAGATSVGEKKWGGVIRLVTPTKQIKEYPFKASYMVGAPSVTVSPTKMNVFYIGVNNPVDILASGVAAENLKATISAGNISKTSKGYVVKVKKPGKVNVSVTAMIDGKATPMGKKLFRVKRVPDPVAEVGGKTGGVISRGVLKAQSGVAAALKNFDFDLKFIVQSFTVSASIKGYEQEFTSKSYKFTAQQKQLISKLKKSQKVYISDIKAKGPDKTIRNLGSIAFKLK